MAASANKYKLIKKLGEGTYAVVYKATDAQNNTYAVKRIKLGEFKDGIDISAIRELKFLQEIRHVNVIALYDVYSDQETLNLVLEFLVSDLEHIIQDKSLIFQTADIKAWMLMSLRGLHHCHRSYIMHRDLKPSNLLIAADGNIKIADFGLARVAAYPQEYLTPTVVTRWYRAPELLLGSRHYTESVDIWAMGAIFAELMLRTPYIPGASDFDQVELTFRVLGTPTEEIWPGVSSLPLYDDLMTKITQRHPVPPPSEISLRFMAASTAALNLLNSMLEYDPSKRPTTESALLSPYFVEELPRPTKPQNLPKPPSFSS
ncbi:hypothetical protein CANCADRAFT_2208 [Tortispora caseinolytica NRRL Y-17796]|uniref:[RNA-polymerase]-subunit kinase n=1 Tax=Tortispora caseinolytica NRRL Y-17796 TaxID=767744 RepID=A0A1E4TFE6_9ASCO|nr:hypothetical protein CANCADRAFT_2208 [Tortispora caseinolytica NRRL Y-17796]